MLYRTIHFFISNVINHTATHTKPLTFPLTSATVLAIEQHIHMGGLFYSLPNRAQTEDKKTFSDVEIFLSYI